MKDWLFVLNKTTKKASNKVNPTLKILGVLFKNTVEWSKDLPIHSIISIKAIIIVGNRVSGSKNNRKLAFSVPH